MSAAVSQEVGVVVGARGMLGMDLVKACRAAGRAVVGFDLPEVDITRPASVDAVLPPCDWLVNCAAYTRVDDAETQRDACWAVNAEGAGHLARWCARRSARMVQISTDYVFDGALGRPCREDDPVCPLNHYGASKSAGEEAVRAAGGRWVILRTQSLFGRHGVNFVATILRRLRDGAPVRVVSDQTSSPTYTGHLAGAILAVLDCGRDGVVHAANSGACTWHEFALAIAAEAGCKSELAAVPSAEYKVAARRPAYSVLDTRRFTEWTGRRLPSWREGLRAYLAEMERAA